jgi:hypothetical protein
MLGGIRGMTNLAELVSCGFLGVSGECWAACGIGTIFPSYNPDLEVLNYLIATQDLFLEEGVTN